MSANDWREQKHAEVFEQVSQQLHERRESDPDFTFEHAEGLLDALYVDQGNDWLGRGTLGHIVSSATIAAYEHFLAEWEDDLEEAEPTEPEPEP